MLRRCHTAELTSAELAEARALLDRSFHDFSDHDWEHSLGGPHALVVEEGRLLACGTLVTRELWHCGAPLRCGYVEAVAVHPDHRRRGLGSVVMAALEELAPAYDVLALSASRQGVPLYVARGWQLWRGPSHVLTADGPTPTPDDDGAIYVLPGSVPLDLDAPLVCDWREGDVW